MSSAVRKISKFVVPVVILIIAVGGAAGLAKLRPTATRGAGTEAVPVVQTLTVSAETIPAKLRATGIVEAARRVTLSPEVSGRTVWVSPKVVPGGRLAKGESLLRVDSRDYKTAVAQSKAQVAQAELAVIQEESRKNVAAKEWKLLGDERPESEAALALRLPQLANARAQLEGARAALGRSETNVGRTTVRAPFAGIVVSESIEVGQVVTPGAQLVTVIGTDEVWVRASVPVQDLLTIQTADRSKTPTIADVILELGASGDVRWKGTAVRLAAEIDTDSRTAQVLFSVKSPLDGASIPLLPGAFVRLEIEGRPIENAVRIPRTGVANGSEVWVVEDGRMTKRAVTIAWRSAKEVGITKGLVDGDIIVTTPLALPIEGMRVSVVGGAKPAAAASSSGATGAEAATGGAQ